MKLFITRVIIALAICLLPTGACLPGQQFDRVPLPGGSEKIRVGSESEDAVPTEQAGPLLIKNRSADPQPPSFEEDQSLLPGNRGDGRKPFQVDLLVRRKYVKTAADNGQLELQFQPDQESANLNQHADNDFVPGTFAAPITSFDQGYFDPAPADYFQCQPNQTFSPASLILDPVNPIIVPRANQIGQGHEVLGPYQARAAEYQNLRVSAGPEMRGFPSDFAPWWLNRVSGRSNPSDDRQLGISLDSLLQAALLNSPHVQVAATESHIQQSTLFQESAAFDWQSFVESRYDDTNDPIGNELTTGNNANRFVQQEWFSRGGMRRRSANGGEIDFAQRVGYLDNNSRFLIPPDQGSARLELNYRQPLMRGRGRTINESLIVLANIDFQTASDDFIEQLQAHLADVTETYWELVRARAEFFQRQKLLESAERVLANLTGRAEVDALDRQVYRARAAVANRRAEIARSLTSIRNAESRLRLLVNEPGLIASAGMEFTPLDLPPWQHAPINLPDAISTAIANRPDISRAIRDLRAAHVRLGVARNDMLPQLDLLFGTYVAGLDGDSDFLNSWVNQFRDGRPGFNISFDYELPVGNRAAEAARQRRQWEVTRSLHQFRATVEAALNEVEIAVREVETAHREMIGRYHSMIAAAGESSFLLDRWQTLPGIDDSVTLLLEDLLDSQVRVADEEAAFARAQFDYAVATVALKQATGVLFQVSEGQSGSTPPVANGQPFGPQPEFVEGTVTPIAN